VIRRARTVSGRLLVWGLAALAVTFPLVLHPTATLLGDGAIDVWNHAWGYWYVAEAIGRGVLPWRTALVGGPEGGILYFIDTPGALAMLPVSWLVGPALAYNLALLLRVALTGLAAQLLAEEIAGPDDATRRAAGWLAGAAAITMPFLLAELRNGIGEVCATQWLILTLWAAARALRRGGLRAWLLVGLLQGVTSVVTFYYGLASAIAVASLVLLDLLTRARRRTLPSPGELLTMAAAALPALALVVPHWLAFRASLSSPDALIRREEELNLRLMAHNAVDPRVFVTPGHFQSVDLAGLYGEPFVHTGYLRLTVVALTLAALVLLPRSRRWGVVLVVSLIAALGPYLWWGGDWVRIGGMPLSLPFEWIRRLLPQVAITHPLRLGLAGQGIAAALAGLGAARLLASRGRAAVALAGALVVAEGLFGSAATWPIPRAEAAVPDVYADAPPGMVLDLPAEVGTGMETSRYFWFQTVHGRPIPYTTDVRMGSARDPETFAAFRAAPRGGQTFAGEDPRTPDRQTLQHIRQTYGLVVVHTDLERRAGLAGAYRAALEPVLGPPEERGELLIWRPATQAGTNAP